jgi:hypothetical protein
MRQPFRNSPLNEGGHANRRGRYLLDVAQECAHPRTFKRHRRHQSRATVGRDLLEIFSDDRRIDHRPAIMHQRRHHSIRVGLQICRAADAHPSRIRSGRWSMRVPFQRDRAVPSGCRWRYAHDRARASKPPDGSAIIDQASRDDKCPGSGVFFSAGFSKCRKPRCGADFRIHRIESVRGGS